MSLKCPAQHSSAAPDLQVISCVLFLLSLSPGETNMTKGCDPPLLEMGYGS